MKLLTEHDLAKKLNKHRQTIANMRKSGKIQPIHIHKKGDHVIAYFYDADVIDRALSNYFKPVEN